MAESWGFAPQPLLQGQSVFKAVPATLVRLTLQLVLLKWCVVWELNPMSVVYETTAFTNKLPTHFIYFFRLNNYQFMWKISPLSFITICFVSFYFNIRAGYSKSNRVNPIHPLSRRLRSLTGSLSMVPSGRLELPRPFGHSDLNAARLPIPPRGQRNN